MTAVSISDVISFLGDRLQAVEGDDSATVGSVAPISPGEPGALSFAVAEKVDLGDALARTLSTAVLVDRPGVLAGDPTDGPADRAVQVVLVVESPRLEFARVTAAFFVRPARGGCPSFCICRSRGRTRLGVLRRARCRNRSGRGSR